MIAWHWIRLLALLFALALAVQGLPALLIIVVTVYIIVGYNRKTHRRKRR